MVNCLTKPKKWITELFGSATDHNLVEPKIWLTNQPINWKFQFGYGLLFFLTEFSVNRFCAALISTYVFFLHSFLVKKNSCSLMFVNKIRASNDSSLGLFGKKRENSISLLLKIFPIIINHIQTVDIHRMPVLQSINSFIPTLTNGKLDLFKSKMYYHPSKKGRDQLSQMEREYLS